MTVPTAPSTGNYQLARPTMPDAYAALHGLYGPHTEDIWRNLLFGAGLTGGETDPSALDRLLAVMQQAEPITRLCARGLQVRVTAYQQLARARAAR